MQYQKIINLLDNKSNQLTKFKTKNWVEITNESRETYNKDYRNANILVNRTITVTNETEAAPKKR